MIYINNKDVIRVEFKGTERPYSSYGRYFKRVHDRAEELTPDELKHMMLFESKCKTCKNNSCNQKKSFEELLRLYSLNTAVKQSELSKIPKIRHSVQNNKLMCDKFYKVIWDCNVKISRIEKELKNEWENLENILYKDMFYYGDKGL